MVTRNHPELGFRGFQFGLTPKRYIKNVQTSTVSCSYDFFVRHKWTILSHPTLAMQAAKLRPTSWGPTTSPSPSRLHIRSSQGLPDRCALRKDLMRLPSKNKHSFTSEKLRKTRKRAYYKSGFMIFQTTILRISSAISDMKYGSLLESKVTCTCWNIYRYLPVYEYLLGNHPFWSFFFSRSGRIRRCLAMWFLQQKLRFRRLGQE